MPSRADAVSMRVMLERAARAVAIVAISVACWLTWRGSALQGTSVSRDVQQVSTGTASLDSIVLRHLARGGVLRDSMSADTLAVALPGIPRDSSRALLGGLPMAGTRVLWKLTRDSASDSVVLDVDATLAATVSRVSGPGGELLVRSTAQHGALVLRDVGGVLDSVPADPKNSGSSWQLRSVAWPLVVSGSTSLVSFASPDSMPVRMVRVLGQPGWEYKFTVAALEELGWKVDGAVRIAPTAQVTLGTPNTLLDTARYAAVVITDSVAVDAAGIQRFVDAGGGAILLGDALRIPALAAMRPAVPTEQRGGIAGALLTDTPLAGLDAWELRVAPDAVVLEETSGDAGGGHAHDEPVVVARRRGAGRVIAVAYRQMWRWRMEGRDDGIDAHRTWWRGALAAVGATKAAPNVPDWRPGAGAPYADMVSWLGPAMLDSARDNSRDTFGQDVLRSARSTWSLGQLSSSLASWLGVLAFGLLCFEWGSRRLRGAL